MTRRKNRSGDPHARPERLDRDVLASIGVLVLGGLMVVLDTTILNVAIGPLSRELDTSLPVISWVLTGYTLALAAVIPIAAWAVGRLGARVTYLLALTAFTAASALAGLAWNVESLIAFRVLQGLGGGLIMPVGMTIALRAAPPSQRGRVLGLLGLPVILGPVAGPVLGGWLLDTVSWRAMFFVNVPIGLLTVVLARRVLARQAPAPRRPLDTLGLALLSPGLAVLVFGIVRAGDTGRLLDPGVAVPCVAGAALVAAFVVHATRAAEPLLRLRLLRLRPMAAGTAVVTLFAAAYFGSAFLVPLYFQVARGESAAVAGLLSVPQGLATGISLQIASRLVDRISPARVVGMGIATATAGFAAFAVQLGQDTPYWRLILSLVVAGVGVGGTLMPVITTATRHLRHDDVPSGTTVLNIASQTATSVGAAVASVLLAGGLAVRVPQARDGLDDVYALQPAALDSLAGPLAAAFRGAFVVPVILMIAALVVAALALPRTDPADRAARGAPRPGLVPGR
jgi:EmrB/QacA subfamily drug resistance transporter